jgi:hypothetical protein
MFGHLWMAGSPNIARRAATEVDPTTAIQWRIAAMHGVARLGRVIPSPAGLLIAAVVVLPVPGLTDESPGEVLCAADGIARRYEADQPSSFIPMACLELQRLGLLGDAQARAAEFVLGPADK